MQNSTVLQQGWNWAQRWPGKNFLKVFLNRSKWFIAIEEVEKVAKFNKWPILRPCSLPGGLDYLDGYVERGGQAQLSLFVCGLSKGLEPALRGLATSLILDKYYVRMFTTFAVLEMVAKLIDRPLLARFFSLRRNEGEHKGSKRWNYFTSCVIFVIFKFIAWVVPSAE